MCAANFIVLHNCTFLTSSTSGFVTMPKILHCRGQNHTPGCNYVCFESMGTDLQYCKSHSLVVAVGTAVSVVTSCLRPCGSDSPVSLFSPGNSTQESLQEHLNQLAAATTLWQGQLLFFHIIQNKQFCLTSNQLVTSTGADLLRLLLGSANSAVRWKLKAKRNTNEGWHPCPSHPVRHTYNIWIVMCMGAQMRSHSLCVSILH